MTMRRGAMLLALFGAAALSGRALAADAAMPKVTLQTTMGDIVLELDPVHAPAGVANFLSYVKDGTFDNTLFYRVVPGFVIQGGTYGADGSGRVTRPPIPLEANNGLKNLRGALSYARGDDPVSAQAEFFIVLVDNPGLDHDPNDPGNNSGYAVFGHVAAGMDVVDKIAGVELGGDGPFPGAAPKTQVIVKKAVVTP